QERMAHFRGLLLINSNESGTTLTAMMPRSANLPAGKRAEAA
ncbi:two-component sensor histidine kinase, partial [Rhizobium sp. Pop5]